MSDINLRLEKIEKDITILHNKLDHITQLLEENVVKNCDKMDQHINFVENVYQNVKNPLGYLCQKVNYAIGNRNYALEYNT